MANKSERRRKEQAKKKAAKQAAMQQPGFKSKYAQRRLRPPILGQQRPRMRHGTAGPNGIPGMVRTYDHNTGRETVRFRLDDYALACNRDRVGGWAVALGAA